ncbi:dipeptidase PepV [Cytobacillus sp. IB215316]|uniref:dipeptidase PepV n=1 Tax=Cytobacillus sp. IB215316 TaxID=3097354 RepID=UPI002A150910|nr:dipeptidase PepV [Cytobacillus sp. IB215316]MDX8359234.1 dipeptidase PepV [Cytobacillus sp. IB215316]
MMVEQINWLAEVNKQKDSIIQTTQELLKIKSILDEENTSKEFPFGEGVAQALHYLLNKGSEDGFQSKNVDNYAGHIEFGEGEESVGVLCHVDVVPEGSGWSSDPFGAEIRDGKIYARGAIDDKGPTIAAYYAMKIVKELSLPLSRRVRMIIGTDEESNWRCVEHYFKHEEMPTMGFAPDADFPIIYAEKGIADIHLIKKKNQNHISSQSDIVLESFQSGSRFNMVPEFAEAKLTIKGDAEQILLHFDSFKSEHKLQGKGYVEDTDIILQLEGKSAHGSLPHLGINAGIHLLSFLKKIQLDEEAQTFVTFVTDYFEEDTKGKALNVEFEDDITGELTINAGILSYHRNRESKIGINVRYPVTNDFEKTKSSIEAACEKYDMTVQIVSHMEPNHVDKDHELIKTLQRVYQEQTGEDATLLSIGGGTYARSLEAGVAFGPLFPGREETAHQKDEYIIIDDLLKATAIYAQAIYELAQ